MLTFNQTDVNKYFTLPINSTQRSFAQHPGYVTTPNDENIQLMKCPLDYITAELIRYRVEVCSCHCLIKASIVRVVCSFVIILFNMSVAKLCEICEESFCNKSNLNRHTKRFHMKKKMTLSKNKQVTVSHKKSSCGSIDIKTLNKVLRLLLKKLVQRERWL